MLFLETPAYKISNVTLASAADGDKNVTSDSTIIASYEFAANEYVLADVFVVVPVACV